MSVGTSVNDYGFIERKLKEVTFEVTFKSKGQERLKIQKMNWRV